MDLWVVEEGRHLARYQEDQEDECAEEEGEGGEHRDGVRYAAGLDQVAAGDANGVWGLLTVRVVGLRAAGLAAALKRPLLEEVHHRGEQEGHEIGQGQRDQHELEVHKDAGDDTEH